MNCVIHCINTFEWKMFLFSFIHLPDSGQKTVKSKYINNLFRLYNNTNKKVSCLSLILSLCVIVHFFSFT